MNASVAIQVLPNVTDNKELCRIVDEVIAYIKSQGLKTFVAPFETTIEGASHVIINISGDISLMDANDAASYVQNLAGDDANIIFGAMYDDSVPDTAKITVIATGLDEATTKQPSVEAAKKEVEEQKKTSFENAGYKMPSFNVPKATTSAPKAPTTPRKDIQIPDFLQRR